MLIRLSPYIAFWIVLYLGREEIGMKKIVVSILIWLGCIVGSIFLGPPLIYLVVIALLDIYLGFLMIV